MIIDERRPIADGISFDDLHDLPFVLANMLSARGVVFATEFKANGRVYAGRIIAQSWEKADEIAFGRGLGETVIGVLAKSGPTKWIPNNGR